MGGNKRKKLKKVLSPTSLSTPQEEPVSNDLVDDLFAELDAREQGEVAQAKPAVVQEVVESIVEKNVKKDSRTRHKEREMRKLAARLAQQGPSDEAAAERIKKETAEEEKAILGICAAEGLEIHEITPDGHCLFSAVADQLVLLSILPPTSASYETTRNVAANYIAEHPDDFLPFLVAFHNEDDPTSHNDGPMTTEDLLKYCSTIRSTGAWGGEPEILALARAYNVPIHVVQWGTPPVVVHSPQNEDIQASNTSKRAVRISYHRRMYGLGEHYNSLRPKLATTSA